MTIINSLIRILILNELFKKIKKLIFTIDVELIIIYEIKVLYYNYCVYV